VLLLFSLLELTFGLGWVHRWAAYTSNLEYVTIGVAFAQWRMDCRLRFTQRPRSTCATLPASGCTKIATCGAHRTLRPMRHTQSIFGGAPAAGSTPWVATMPTSWVRTRAIGVARCRSTRRMSGRRRSSARSLIQRTVARRRPPSSACGPPCCSAMPGEQVEDGQGRPRTGIARNRVVRLGGA
jgi:hypothetical protein